MKTCKLHIGPGVEGEFTIPQGCVIEENLGSAM